MTRKVDDLGRIVLPVEMRRRFDIRTGDELTIAVDGDSIVLTKIEVGCVFCRSTESLQPLRAVPICGDCRAEIREFGK